MLNASPVIRILFVCTGNICRSPTAEGVFRKILASRGAATRFDIDSAGMHEYYTGKPPYPHAVAAAKARGYDLTHLVARRIRSHDFDHFDLILGMDRSNIASLKTVCNRVAALADGKIVAIGAMDDLLHSEHPWVKAYFHGKRSLMLHKKPD